jgi:chromosome segregation ATPase
MPHSGRPRTQDTARHAEISRFGAAPPLQTPLARMEATMRKMIYSMLFGALIAGGTACKKDNSETTDESGAAVRKAQEEVADQKEDVADQAKDVNDEMKDVNKEAGKLSGETNDVAKAQQDLATARATYSSAVVQRLAKLDAKIAELTAKGTTEAKATAADLKVRRDALAKRLDSLATQTDQGWADYTRQIDSDFDAIEKDVFDALD